MNFDELTKNVPELDATDRLTITIRRKDIDGAIFRNPEQCVVARSLIRSMKGEGLAVKIGAEVAKVFDGKVVWRYHLSAETRRMIYAYDKAEFYPAGVVAKLNPVKPSRRKGARVEKPQYPNRNPGTKPSKARPWLRHINQEGSS